MFFTARAMVADRCSRLGFQEGVQIGHRIWMQDEIARIETLLEHSGVCFRHFGAPQPSFRRKPESMPAASITIVGD